jgi:hypothetical protein
MELLINRGDFSSIRSPPRISVGNCAAIEVSRTTVQRNRSIANPKQRGFTCARRTNQGYRFTRSNIEIHTVQNGFVAVTDSRTIEKEKGSRRQDYPSLVAVVVVVVGATGWVGCNDVQDNQPNVFLVPGMEFPATDR